jgi:hypothetical protein
VIKQLANICGASSAFPELLNETETLIFDLGNPGVYNIPSNLW